MKIKGKLLILFSCLVVLTLLTGLSFANDPLDEQEGGYAFDYYIKGGVLATSPYGTGYGIYDETYENGTLKWIRPLQGTPAIGIQRYTVLVQEARAPYRLFGINKYTGNNRWTMKLDQRYNRLQFIGGKYAVLMNQNKFIQVNLYTRRIVTGKTFPAPATEHYSLIKSKKNGNYYVMTIGNDTKFYKLNTS